MNSGINILFLGGGKRVSIAEVFINAGKALNRNVTIFSYELNKYEPIATAGIIVEGLKWNDPHILDHLENVLKQYDINIVVPFVDIATILCGRLQQLCPSVYFCVSNEYISNITFDKKKSDDWFRANNFLIPSKELTVPVIAKLNRGSGAKGIKFFYDALGLNEFIENENFDDYFVQEVIEGEEFSVDCFVDIKGRIISVVPRKRIEVINGEATRSKTIKDIQVINQSVNVLKAGDFSGPVTIQFIRNLNTGLLYLIEINPRLGSGVLTSIAAGADVCKCILMDFLNIDIPSIEEWKENVLMVRAFKEYYFYAVNN
jgi:carbamoyl-phosphate synthase large subunit